jgi:hypothetical protein
MNSTFFFGSGAAPFEIWIERRDREAAEQVLNRIQDSGENAQAAPGSEPNETQWGDEEENAAPSVDDLDQEFFSDEDAAEVWRGDTPGMAEILRDCLGEHRIACRIEAEKSEEEILFVRPDNEPRARQIVGQVTGFQPQA